MMGFISQPFGKSMSNNLKFSPSRQAHVFVERIWTMPPGHPYSEPRPSSIISTFFPSLQGLKASQHRCLFVVQQLVFFNESYGGNLRFLPCKKSWSKREFIETSKPQAGRRCYSVKLQRPPQTFPTAFWKLERSKPSSYAFCGFREVNKNPLESTSKNVTILMGLLGKGLSPASYLRSPAKKKTGNLILSFLSHPMIP